MCETNKNSKRVRKFKGDDKYSIILDKNVKYKYVRIDKNFSILEPVYNVLIKMLEDETADTSVIFKDNLDEMKKKAVDFEYVLKDLGITFKERFESYVADSVLSGKETVGSMVNKFNDIPQIVKEDIYADYYTKHIKVIPLNTYTKALMFLRYKDENGTYVKTSHVNMCDNIIREHFLKNKNRLIEKQKTFNNYIIDVNEEKANRNARKDAINLAKKEKRAKQQLNRII